MEALFQLEVPGLSRAEYLDLKGRAPQGAVDAVKVDRSREALGVLDPITATVVVTLGLAAITALAVFLVKNRRDTDFEFVRVLPNGAREKLKFRTSSSISNAEVVRTLTELAVPPTMPTSEN